MLEWIVRGRFADKELFPNDELKYSNHSAHHSLVYPETLSKKFGVLNKRQILSTYHLPPKYITGNNRMAESEV